MTHFLLYDIIGVEQMANRLFSLQRAEEVRNALTVQNYREIYELYQEISKEIKEQIKQSENENIKQQNLVILQNRIKRRMDELHDQIYSKVRRSCISVGQALVEDTREFLKKCGFRDADIRDAFLHIPSFVVETIFTGQVYKPGWNFSSVLWRDVEKTKDDIDKVVAMGVQQGKSTYDIAKDLERYVNPSARKDWSWSKVYPGTKKVVDYNAQRLARTLISDAYQQNFMAVNEHNPFVQDYVWHSALAHGRTCDICRERNGKHFKKDELPKDHPNGLCTFTVYIPNNAREIGRQIGRWYNAPKGTYPDIDKFVESMKG